MDTLDNVGLHTAAKGVNADLFGSVSEENVARIKRQNSRRISVVNHWQSETADGVPGAADEVLAPEARFLRAIHDGACRYFDAVLGPDYNSAHADHFHFDRGQARACR